jgi:hypothetical protein
MKNIDRNYANSSLGPTHWADYFGLEVEVVILLPNCSLISYGSREFIALTQDLQPIGLRARHAAA